MTAQRNGSDAKDFGARVLGPVLVAADTPEAAVAAIVAALAARTPAIFAFCNAHSVNVARRDPEFAAALRGMTVFNDGIGVEIGSRMIYGQGFPANLNGTDLTPRLLAAVPGATRVFLLGCAPGIAERAAAAIAQLHPNVAIVGTQHGFFSAAEAAIVAERIRDSGAQLVLVGMGQPRQEMWAAQWTTRIGAVTCCIGAFLDFTAGVVPRAPHWAQRFGVEWLYRLGQEPRRLARRYIMGNPSFLLAMTGIALRERLSGKARAE